VVVADQSIVALVVMPDFGVPQYGVIMTILHVNA
jgi:hypothetical protein